MKKDDVEKSPHRQWAEFRFSVIGQLLAAPPKAGELALELRKLAEKSWQHPKSGMEMRLGLSTIEGWYYVAKNELRDPLARLRSKPRSDLGKSRRVNSEVAEILKKQYSEYPSWAYRLHSDNLLAELKTSPHLGKAPSYQTVRRFMKAHGFRKKRKPRNATEADSINNFERREVRSYEVEFVNALWHFDYHHGSFKVLDEQGVWVVPNLMGIFDDHSRLCCHMQWYTHETSENLVHAFSQAIMKRGLPRKAHSDNGSAMICEEFRSGLARLSPAAVNTLPYSPYQNGKCEHSWTKVEGRLMAMLGNYKDLTMKLLNDITQAWVEMEYNRQIHRETGERPIDRFINGKNVGLASPSPEILRQAFRREVKRIQRRSDGTIALENLRFEIPSRFRHMEDIFVRYASWNLSFVHLIDFRTGEEVCRIYPIDKAQNADGRRRLRDEPVIIARPEPTAILPPLLKNIVDEYMSLGLRPAYLPKSNEEKCDEQ